MNPRCRVSLPMVVSLFVKGLEDGSSTVSYHCRYALNHLERLVHPISGGIMNLSSLSTTADLEPEKNDEVISETSDMEEENVPASTSMTMSETGIQTEDLLHADISSMDRNQLLELRESLYKVSSILDNIGFSDNQERTRSLEDGVDNNIFRRPLSESKKTSVDDSSALQTSTTFCSEMESNFAYDVEKEPNNESLKRKSSPSCIDISGDDPEIVTISKKTRVESVEEKEDTEMVQKMLDTFVDLGADSE